MTRNNTAYQRLNDRIKTLENEGGARVPTGHNSRDIDRHFDSVIKYDHIPADKKAQMLEGVIIDAYNGGYLIQRYLREYKIFCEKNRL